MSDWVKNYSDCSYEATQRYSFQEKFRKNGIFNDLKDFVYSPTQGRKEIQLRDKLSYTMHYSCKIETEQTILRVGMRVAIVLVQITGLEPAASCAQGKRTPKLS